MKKIEKIKKIILVLGILWMAVGVAGCENKADEAIQATTITENSQTEPTEEIEKTEEIETADVAEEIAESAEKTKAELGQTEAAQVEETIDQQKKSEEKAMTNSKMTIKIGDTTLTATLEDNDSVDALRELMTDRTFTIHFSQYGGFEQVGSIGSDLPRNDVQTTTSAGDIVLYSGNQMVMFYGSNTWAYTRLGKIDDVSASDLQEILGDSEVTATFSIEK